LGLIEKKPLVPQKITDGDYLVIVGDTKDELGGSEYFEYIHKVIGGTCPAVNFKDSKKNMKAVLDVISKQILKSAHDCSKGGLAVAVSELCMTSDLGCNVSLDAVPGEKLPSDRVLFSESHSRYLLTVERKNITKLEKILKKNNVSFKTIGKFEGKEIRFTKNKKSIINLNVSKTKKTWMSSLKNLVLSG